MMKPNILSMKIIKEYFSFICMNIILGNAQVNTSFKKKKENTYFLEI